MTNDELAARLRAHDHYYQWSDDPTAFAKGQDDCAQLLIELRKIPLSEASDLILDNVPYDRQMVWMLDLTQRR
jgi:hypothetical protein